MRLTRIFRMKFKRNAQNTDRLKKLSFTRCKQELLLLFNNYLLDVKTDWKKLIKLYMQSDLQSHTKKIIWFSLRSDKARMTMQKFGSRFSLNSNHQVLLLISSSMPFHSSFSYIQYLSFEQGESNLSSKWLNKKKQFRCQIIIYQWLPSSLCEGR